MSERAAVYVRVSSADQESGYSLGTQERDCREYAESRGYTVATVYREVYTGVELETRPELSRLRQAVRAGELDAVVVWHFDRLSREQDDRVYLRVEARLAGCRYESVHDPMGASDEDQLVENVRAYAAKVEWRRIRERSLAGVRARVEQGGKLIPGNRPRYGYAWSDAGEGEKGGLVEDPATAWVVRLIYERIAAGTPVRRTCIELQERGIPAPRGGARWGSWTLNQLIRSPYYKGEGVAYSVQTSKVNGKRKRARRPAEERVALPAGTVAALVSPEEWQAANERINGEHRRTRYAPGEDPQDVLVRGHVRCECGYRMHIKRLADGPYLNCQAKARTAGNCPGNMVRAATLDRAVWERVRWLLTDPAVVLSTPERERQAEQTGEDTGTLEREIVEAGRQEANVAGAIARGLSGPALDALLAKLGEVGNRRAALRARLDEVVTANALLAGRTVAVRGWVERLIETAPALDALDYEGRRERLRQLGVEVAVHYRDAVPRFDVGIELPIPAEQLWPEAELSDEERAEAERQIRKAEDESGSDSGPGGESTQGCRTATVDWKGRASAARSCPKRKDPTCRPTSYDRLPRTTPNGASD